MGSAAQVERMRRRTYEECPSCERKGVYLLKDSQDKRCRYCGHLIYFGRLSREEALEQGLFEVGPYSDRGLKGAFVVLKDPWPEYHNLRPGQEVVLVKNVGVYGPYYEGFRQCYKAILLAGTRGKVTYSGHYHYATLEIAGLKGVNVGSHDFRLVGVLDQLAGV